MTAAELVTTFRARGVTLVADGEVLRCRPKSALNEDDLAILRSRKPEILAYLRRVLAPAPPLACFSCRGRRFWRSVHGAVVCAACHPPADPSLFAGWINAAERPRSLPPPRPLVPTGTFSPADLPGASLDDVARIERFLGSFGAEIVSVQADDGTDGAA